ncbi:tetratricopeptide repeat protein [Candidatus Peregrinibacteria bacterium]|nr:tetratricopeptide repeat protein [Candidatus Peregrinibacteria bacterium]
MTSNKRDDEQELDHDIEEALSHIEELKLSGSHQESIKEAEKLLCDNPNCVHALEEIADNYVSLDQFDRAEKACERALKLNEKSYTAKYILGFISSQKQNWPKAISYLKSSNDLHSNNPEILRCLGWAMFNNRKRTQGIVILERALNLDPDNSLTLCDLGICYLQTKNFDKSVELLKHAMDIDPDNNRVKECLNAAKGFKERYLKMNK